MANLYTNANAYEVFVPTREGTNIRVPSGRYIRGAYYSEFPTLTYVSDESGIDTAVGPDKAIVYSYPVTSGAAADGVTTLELAIDSVETENIKNLNVTTGKLAAKAVTTAKIADNAVTDAQLPAAGITAVKLDATSSGCTVTTGASGLKVVVPAGESIPGGTDATLQYNNGGAFDGIVGSEVSEYGGVQLAPVNATTFTSSTAVVSPSVFSFESILSNAQDDELRFVAIGANTANGLVRLQVDDSENSKTSLVTVTNSTVDISATDSISVSAPYLQIFDGADLQTAPATAASTGTKGEFRVCADGIYFCIATDTWVKTALATWV